MNQSNYASWFKHIPGNILKGSRATLSNDIQRTDLKVKY